MSDYNTGSLPNDYTTSTYTIGAPGNWTVTSVDINSWTYYVKYFKENGWQIKTEIKKLNNNIKVL